MNITDWQRRVHELSCEKGWWNDIDGGGPGPRDAVIRLALVQTEVSEAIQSVRDGQMVTQWDGEPGASKPYGFPIELVDALFRLLDTAEAFGIDTEAAMRDKFAYNMTRPHRHGGKLL